MRFWLIEFTGVRMYGQLSNTGMRYVTQSTERGITCIRKTTLDSIAAVPYPMICGLRLIKLETWKHDVELIAEVSPSESNLANRAPHKCTSAVQRSVCSMAARVSVA